jgi:hypothetical protein
MSDAVPLIRKLQAEAVNPDASVTNLLRIAKIAATKLNLNDALIWIDRELNGYMDLQVEDLPPYRLLKGIPKGYNPYHGWQPIQFPDSETAKNLSQAPIGWGLGAIEKSVNESSGNAFAFPYPAELKRTLQKSLRYPVDVHVAIERAQLWNIVDQVRNLILNWALELEKAGVLGENMQFSEQEKGDARPVTQQYIIQNVGVLGTVTDQASVTNRQTASVAIELDLGQVRELLTGARMALPSLPKSTQDAVRPLLEAIEGELKNEKPNSSKLREWLASLRKICEGAVGSVTAQGVVAMARAVLGG